MIFCIIAAKYNDGLECCRLTSWENVFFEILFFRLGVIGDKQQNLVVNV